MPLSWNEIRSNSIAFSREWAGESREHAEAKTFWDQFFAVFGLFDARYAGLAGAVGGADLLLEHSVSTLERRLPAYDLGYWSRADLYAQDPVMPASRFYHRLHVAQLKVMHELTGRERFAHYARRWASNDADFASRARALSKKIYFKLRHY